MPRLCRRLIKSLSEQSWTASTKTQHAAGLSQLLSETAYIAAVPIRIGARLPRDPSQTPVLRLVGYRAAPKWSNSIGLQPLGTTDWKSLIFISLHPGMLHDG